jgi:hypothetical protein
MTAALMTSGMLIAGWASASAAVPPTGVETGSAAAVEALPPAVPTPAVRLDFHRDLPRDPLAVIAGRLEDPDEALRSLSAALALGGVAFDLPTLLEGLEGAIGFPIRERLLATLGPDWALVIDLPPVDPAVAAMDGSGAELVSTLLSRVGIVVGVRDEQATRTAAAALFAGLGIVPVDEGDGLSRIRVRTAEQPAPGTGEFGVVYGIARGRLVVGISPEWVEEMLGERGAGRSLEHGADFTRVFVHLDPDAQHWVYVNLPRARRMLADSHVLRALVGSTPAGRVRLDEALGGTWMEVGFGASSVAVDGGLRTSSFGPRDLAGGLLAGGIAALARLPGSIRSEEGDRARETLADMERIAGACERFSTDAAGYPGPTDGLWPVERIAAYLEPIYLSALPRHDAWNNPILYWSDGSTYRLVSTGQDGAMDRDWSRPGPFEPLAGPPSDIVYDTGRVIAGPRAD